MSVGLFLPQVPRQSMEETLDVRDTLSKANAVLQTHRDKMKRRSSSVSPFPSSDPSPQPLPPPSLLSGWTEEQEDEEIEEVSLVSPQKGVTKLLSGGRGRVAPIQSVWEDKENQVDTPTELFVSTDKDSSSSCTRTSKETVPASQEVPLFSLLTTPTASHISPSQDAPSPSLPFSPSIQRVIPTNNTNTEDTSISSNAHMSPSTPAPSHPLPPSSPPSLPPLSVPPSSLSPPSGPASTKQLLDDEGVNDDEELTESELLEYQLFLKRLQSSSSGRVVTVAPAPSDRCSSYLKHNRSKVGVENVIALTTSTNTLNEESGPSSSGGSLIGASENEPIRMVRVLPVNYPGKGKGAVIVKSGDDNNDSKKNKEKVNDDVAEYSNELNKSNDLIIEETDEWIPPTDEPGPLSPSVPISSHHKEDIGIEECDNEDSLISDSGVSEYQSEPWSSSRRDEPQSSRRNGSQSTEKHTEKSPSMVIHDSLASNRSQPKKNGSKPKRNKSESKRNGSEYKRNGSESKRNGSEPKRNESESKMNRPESEMNGSESKRNEAQSERSNEYQHTANLTSVSSELTLVDISEEKDEEEEEDNFKDSPQAIERDRSKKVLNEMERGEEGEEGENEGMEKRIEEVPEMPLLRVKSTTSLYVPGKRERGGRMRGIEG